MVTQSVVTFGDLLRQHRRAAGLTQEDLAERAGLSVTGVQKLERGVTHPYRDTAQRLLTALQLPPEEEAQLRAAVQRVRRTVASHHPALDGAARDNLPVPISSFIGRGPELLDLAARLATTRLLTLTGVGGCGKTRLALELARGVSNGYADGVCLVELGPLANPDLVSQRVAAAVGARETAARRADDSVTPQMRVRALEAIGLFASRQGNYAVSRECSEASVAAWRELNDPVKLGGALAWLGLAAWSVGDAAQAVQMLEESLHMLEASGDDEFVALPLRNLGMVARSQGDYPRAAEFFRASLARARAFSVWPRAYVLARSLCHLGRTAFLQGELEQATRHFHEGLLIMRDALLAGHTLADCLDWVAAAADNAGQPIEAARLLGAAEAQWRASGAVRYPPERAAYAEDHARVRSHLDADTFAAAWAEGDAMDAATAIDYALQLTSATDR